MDEIISQLLEWYEKHEYDQIWTGSAGYNLCADEELKKIVNDLKSLCLK
jgi:hypothetical protein